MAIKKKHSHNLKFQVALESLKEQKTIVNIAKEFSVHPTQINKWKRQLKKKKLRYLKIALLVIDHIRSWRIRLLSSMNILVSYQ